MGKLICRFIGFFILTLSFLCFPIPEVTAEISLEIHARTEKGPIKVEQNINGYQHTLEYGSDKEIRLDVWTHTNEESFIKYKVESEDPAIGIREETIRIPSENR